MGGFGVGLHRGHLLPDLENLTRGMEEGHHASHWESWQSECLRLCPGLELDPRLEHLPSTLPSSSFRFCKPSCRRISGKADRRLSSVSLRVEYHGDKG